MRREELFMDILGGLDEKYVSMAMPRSCGHSTVGDAGNVIEIKPVEISPEVSRKDMRIYWITRTLGMAAAAVFIIGAAVLLIMNWDKIAVSEPDRPGVVTTVGTSSAVTATSLTEPTKSENNTADSDKINELRKRIGEKKREIENAESAKNAYVQKADDAGGRLTALTEKLEELRALDETSETIQEISAAEAEIEYYSELKAAYDKEISNYEEHIDSLKRELSDLEHEELLEVEKMRDIQHSETTTYVNENKERPVTTSSENHEITTSETTVVPTDEASETTATAEEQPTDEELKALVEQGAEACGLTVTVSKLTRGSLQLDYKLDENAPFAGIWYLEWYDHYEIQVQNASGEWETYDPEGYEEFFSNGTIFDGIHMLGVNIDGFRGEEWQTVLFYGNYVFGDMYESELPNGKYRIMKKLSAYSTATGEYIGSLTVSPEFEINDLTQNIFDIVLSVSNVSPEGVTVEAEQDGRDFLYMKNTIGYRPAFTLQRYENGRWVGVPTKDGGIPSWNDAIYPVTVGGKIEINRDFSNIYGSLTDGRYRISTTFVNYYVEPSGMTSILNESVYYIEFPVGDYTYNKFGIWLEVEDVSAEGMTLVITQRGGSYTGELEYGEPYSVERKNGDKWEPVKFLNDEVAWIDLAYDVESNSDKEEKLDWKWLYGTLPAGTYRIAKEFTDYRGPGDSDTQMYYAAFRITDDMASKLGIALRATKYNARKMTLQILQTGDTGYEKIGTNPHRYTIERKTDGIWQSYYAPQAGVPTPDLGLKVKNSGVTEYKLDWSEAAGSLPVGDYRLGMTFSCGDITETRYCEFTIEESMTNEFGISIEVLEVSKAGAKLGIKSKGADEQGFAYFDGKFGLQKQTKNGNWKDIEVSGEPSWPQYAVSKIMMATTGYSGQMINIDWTSIFGKLENGHYRVSKTFHTGEGESYKEITLYAEFDINADTPEQGLY